MGLKLLHARRIIDLSRKCIASLEYLTELGVTKIRLTGGEPFVRKDFVGFLEMLIIQ